MTAEKNLGSKTGKKEFRKFVLVSTKNNLLKS